MLTVEIPRGEDFGTLQPKLGRLNHAAFKAKVGTEPLIGVKTFAQIARENPVHPVQESLWRAVIRDRLPELFEAVGNLGEANEKLLADLHQEIGERTVDLEWASLSRIAT